MTKTTRVRHAPYSKRSRAPRSDSKARTNKSRVQDSSQENASKSTKNNDGVSVRPRKLNTDRPLLILRPQELNSLRNTQRHILDNAHQCHFVGASLHLTAKDLEMFRDSTTTNAVLTLDPTLSHSTDAPISTSTSLAIPIPSFRIHNPNGTVIDSSDTAAIDAPRPKRRPKKLLFKTLEDSRRTAFRLPSRLIKSSSLNTYDIASEYDMQSDDEEWLAAYNSKRAIGISDTDLERVCALAERIAMCNVGHVTVTTIQNLNKQILETQELLLKRVDPDDLNTHTANLFPSHRPVTSILTSQPLRDSDVHDVLQHWCAKKNNPVLVALKQQEHNVAAMEAQYRQMFKLRQDFERVRILMELIGKRERTKKKLVQAHHEELEAFLCKDKNETPTSHDTSTTDSEVSPEDTVMGDAESSMTSSITTDADLLDEHSLQSLTPQTSPPAPTPTEEAPAKVFSKRNRRPRRAPSISPQKDKPHSSHHSSSDSGQLLSSPEAVEATKRTKFLSAAPTNVIMSCSRTRGLVADEASIFIAKSTDDSPQHYTLGQDGLAPTKRQNVTNFRVLPDMVHIVRRLQAYLGDDMAEKYRPFFVWMAKLSRA